MKGFAAIFPLLFLSACDPNANVQDIPRVQVSELATLPTPTAGALGTCVATDTATAPSDTTDTSPQLCIDSLLTFDTPTPPAAGVLPSISIVNYFADQKILALLDTAKAGNTTPPPATPLNLKLVLRNPNAASIVYFKNSDNTHFAFNIAGPGYINPFRSNPILTTDIREAEPITLPPGSAITIAFASLLAGNRGVSDYSYLLKEGTYRIQVQGQINISPTAGGSPIAMQVLSNTVDFTASFAPDANTNPQ